MAVFSSAVVCTAEVHNWTNIRLGCLNEALSSLIKAWKTDRTGSREGKPKSTKGWGQVSLWFSIKKSQTTSLLKKRSLPDSHQNRTSIMEISGKIIELLPEKSGQSARGPWRKQEYVLETEGQYPKKICFMVWGDKIDELAIKGEENLVVSIDIESREYNGRWYTDVKAWQIKRAGADADNIPFTAPDTAYAAQAEDPHSFVEDVIPF
jgi:hypothetical protein